MHIRNQLSRVDYQHSPFLLPSLIVAVTVVSPLLGRSHGKYLLGLYVALVNLVFMRSLPRLRQFPFLYLYIFANAVAMFIHLESRDSVLNAGSLIVSITSITALAHYTVVRYGARVVDRTLETWLWISLVASIILSIMLTSVHWPLAPDSFPWEAFYSSKRLLLLSGEEVGHSPSLWIVAFISAFTVHRFCMPKAKRTVLAILLIVLFSFLLATKSRLALVYSVNLLVMLLAYVKVPFMRKFVFVLPGVVAVSFLLLSVIPGLGPTATVKAQAIQNAVGGWVRVTPEEETRATVFSGRDVLNQALQSASLTRPLRGLGDDADILLYGIDREGSVAYTPSYRLAGTESVLRLAVKYGWLYFVALALFLFSIPLSITRMPKQEQILKATLWGMAVESIASEGGMEMFYDVSGLFLLVFCVTLFEAKAQSRHEVADRLAGMERCDSSS